MFIRYVEEMRRLTKYILRGGLVIILTLLLLPFSLYIPKVQDFVRNKVTAIASEKTNFKISIDYISLRFPLSLQIDNSNVQTQDGDTIFHSGKARLKARIWPLFFKKISIEEFSFDNVILHYSDSTSNFIIDGRLDKLLLAPNETDLGNHQVNLSTLNLSGGKVYLSIGESRPDTTAQSQLLWKFLAGTVTLENIDYAMDMPEMHLKALLGKASVTGCDVNLETQIVTAKLAEIRNGNYTYLTIPATDTVTVVNDSLNDTGQPSAPWTVSVDHVSLKNNEATYGTQGSIPLEGLDFQLIKANDINIEIDSFYNQKFIVKADLKHLSLHERSGFTLTGLSGTFSMDSTSMKVNNCILQTPNSSIQATTELDKSVFQKYPGSAFKISIDAKIGLKDLALLFPQYMQSYPSYIFENPLQCKVDISGTLNQFSIEKLDVSMERYLSFSGHGSVTSLLSPADLSGELHFNGNLPNPDPITKLFINSASFKIPHGIVLNSNIYAKNGYIRPSLKISLDKGYTQLNGFYNFRNKSYLADVDISNFALNKFITAKELGNLSAQIKASGSGVEILNKKTKANLDLHIESLPFNGYNYNDIDFNLALHENLVVSTLTSQSPALKADIRINGLIKKHILNADATGYIQHINFKELNLTDKDCYLSFKFATGSSLNSEAYSYFATSKIQDFLLYKDYHETRISDLTATAEADTKHVTASLHSDDIHLDFKADASLENFITKIDSTITFAKEQISLGNFNFEQLKKVLPKMHLDISAAANNSFNNFLRSKGYSFRKFTLNASTEKDVTFVTTLQTVKSADIVLDTIQFRFYQNGEALDYFLGVSNTDKNPLHLDFLKIKGSLLHNTLLLSCIQQNDDKKQGFNFDCKTVYEDSLLTFRLLSENPVFGYQKWNINKSNYISYQLNRAFAADFTLHSGTKKVSVMSELEDKSIHVLINGIDIKTSLQLLPIAPPMEGTLDTDLTLTPAKKDTQIDGSISIHNLRYNKQRVGDMLLDVNYKTDATNNFLVKAGLSFDNVPAVLINGTYYTSGQDSIDVDIDIPALPLRVINPFFPVNSIVLSGDMKSHIQAKGSPKTPIINGYISFIKSFINVPATGTTFGLPSENILLDNNKILFNRYAITAPNKNDLYIDGFIDAKDFAKIQTDVTATAKNFQIVNVSKNSNSLIYGKSLIDLNASVRGPLDELTIKGDVNLLNGTEINYTMRNSPLEVQDTRQNMVTFVSFNDSLSSIYKDSIPALKIVGMDVKMNIAIENGVKMKIDLSEDGQNSINVQGGGNLTYSQNQLGDSRFSGRYVLTSGTVRYNPPVISEKIFNIQDGSYIEWNGNIANPTLNISAVQTVHATVTETDGTTRSVDFNVIINIKNSLESLSLTFNLETPNDMTIQSQLASLTQEQRSTQALNLLLYNMYNGPGTTAKVERDPINDFIQKELNQWASEYLKNVDISFGIGKQREMKNGAPTTRTDYSYTVSKSLFNDRVKLVIGGGFSPDDNAGENFKQNLIEDISVEYMLDKKKTMYLKLFRQAEYESIIEGEVYQSGIGFVVRKKLKKLKSLFQLSEEKHLKKEEKKQQQEEK